MTLYLSDNLQSHNRVNCKHWQEIPNAKGGICDNREAWKHFKWDGPLAMRPGKLTCVNCPLREAFSPDEPVILGEIMRVKKTTPVPAAPRIDIKDWMKKHGPELWTDFHRELAVLAAEEVERWLTAWESRVTCRVCGMHWRKIRKENPLDNSSPIARCKWGWRVHLIVSKEKEEPTQTGFTWENAVDLYEYPIEWKPS